jgi:nucleotide-binding universal stress UspA family protein
MMSVKSIYSRGRSPRLPEDPLASILVPLDLTPISDRVVRRVALLPLRERARITLLHVVPDTLSQVHRRGAKSDAARALAAEALHLRARVRPDVRIETRVAVGAAPKTIGAAATSIQADLIVTGRGSGRILDALLGSTAERVIRQSRRPVLVVQGAARHQYCRPSLALDLDHAAPRVVATMLRVVPPPRPPILVIHAYDDPYHTLSYPSLSETAGERKAELRQQASQALARVRDKALNEAKVSAQDAPRWKTLIQYGSPRLLIERTVRRAKPDLLALGTRAHSGLSYAFFGTVAGDVLRHVRCDVLVVPPRRPKR